MIYLQKLEYQDMHIKNDYEEIKTKKLIKYNDIDMILKWLDKHWHVLGYVPGDDIIEPFNRRR